MTEGELKQRLIKPYIDDDEHVCPTLIDIIVDEAKKKFPTVEQAVEEIKKSDLMLSKPQRSVFPMDEIRSMQLELTQNCFREQFGDST